jgi:asparaginyl-tRNA synthetase
MVEPEVAFATLDDVMTLAEEFITSIVQSVLKNRRAELQALERDVTKLEQIAPPFPRLPYDEAVKNLQSRAPRFSGAATLAGGDETILSQQFEPPRHGASLSSSGEGLLHGALIRRDQSLPCALTCSRRRATERSLVAANALPALELLNQRIQEHHLPPEAFDWYLDLRKYGTFPHAGFGMGIERAVAWICGLEHVRETIPFPRMLYRLRP